MVGLAYSGFGWQIVLLFCVMGLVGMSGPGALVTKWFVRNRGKAVAFAGFGIPIGSLIFVNLTQVFIDAWDWRTAWIVLAAIGAGAPVAGYVYDATGTYNQIWWAGVALMAFGAVLIAFTRAPNKSAS